MPHRAHWPDRFETGYGVSWVSCSVCNRDKRIEQFAERGIPLVCDECREEQQHVYCGNEAFRMAEDEEEYEWTRYGTAPDDREVTE